CVGRPGEDASPSAAAAAGIKVRLANAPAPSKADTFRAVLLFMVSTSHLHLRIACRKHVQIYRPCAVTICAAPYRATAAEVTAATDSQNAVPSASPSRRDIF